MRVGDDHRGAGGEQVVAELADKGRAVALVQEFGLADVLVDPARSRRLVGEMMAGPGMGIIGLDVTDRSPVQMYDVGPT